MWNLSFRVQTFCFPVRMPYKPGWLFCLWGTVRQQSQCTSGGKKARGPRRQKRFVCDGASKQQGRILSFDQATYLVSKRDQTSNFQRIKKKTCPHALSECQRLYMCGQQTLVSWARFFPVAPGQGAMQQLALRWFSWQASGRWSRSESSKFSAAYVRKTTLGQLPCKEGSSPFSAAIFLCRRTHDKIAAKQEQGIKHARECYLTWRNPGH